MSSDTDDDASDLKEFDYTAYRNLYTYHAHTLSKTLHRSRESQERLREFRNSAPKTEIQIFENSEILVASEDVTSSEIVLELNGLVGTIQDRIERTPTLFRSDLMDTQLLILTSTGFHGPAYAIRRSAHPNCHLEHVICHLEPIAWILKANKSIPRGTEITVAFDFPPERGTVDRPRPEVIRRRMVDGYVNVKARERMPPSPTSSESESPDANTTTSGSSESITSSDSPPVSPRVPMSAPLKRIRTENGWKTLPAKEKILKKSTSSENPKKKKKKSGGRWGPGWTAKTRKRKVGGAKTTVTPKIRKLDSEFIVTSSESRKVDSNAIRTSSASSKVKNSEAASSEAILTSSDSSKIVYSILTSSESQKTNSENINPNLTSSEAQKIDNLDFENSEFPKLTSSDSDETQKLEKSVCPRVPMSAPLKRIRTENGWKTLPAKEKKIPPKIDNPQKSMNQRKKKKPRRQPWSSGGGRKKKMGFAIKKKTVVTSSESDTLVFGDSEVAVTSSDGPDVNLVDSEISGVAVTSSNAREVNIDDAKDSEDIVTPSDAPEVEKDGSKDSEAAATSSEAPVDKIDDTKDSEAAVTSSNAPEVEKTIVMVSGALPTSSETGEFDIEHSGEPGIRLTSSESRNSDSEASEAFGTSSESQNVDNDDSGALVTSSNDPKVTILDFEASEAPSTSSVAPNDEIEDVKDSEIVTSSNASEVEKSIVTPSGALLKSSESGDFEMEDSGETVTSSEFGKFKNQDSKAPETLTTSSETPEVKIEDPEAPEAFGTSSEGQKSGILDSEALEEDLTSSESRNSKNQYSEYPEDVVKIEDDSDVSMEFGEAADLLIFAENVEMNSVTPSGVPEEESELTTTTSSEVFQNLLLTFSPEIPEILDSEDVTASEIRKNLQSTFFPEITENLDSEVPTSSEIFQNSPPLKTAENLDSEPKVPEDSEARIGKILENYRIYTSSEKFQNSQALKIAENAQNNILEIFENTYSEDVSALLKKTSLKKCRKTEKVKYYLLQNLKIRSFRKIQNSEDPEDVKLMTYSAVAPGDILLELIGHVALLTEVPEAERTGKWMYTADFLTKNAPESAFGDHRYTKSIFCIDPINECRFLRRSCKPNAHFDHFIDSEDVLKIIVTPIRRIPENSEITLKFDWDFAIDSKEPLKCALHQFNMSNCPVERQRMRNLAVERGLPPPQPAPVRHSVIYSNPPQFLQEHNYQSLSDRPKAFDNVDLMVKSVKCDLCDVYWTNRKSNLFRHLQDVHGASPEEVTMVKEALK